MKKLTLLLMLAGSAFAAAPTCTAPLGIAIYDTAIYSINGLMTGTIDLTLGYTTANGGFTVQQSVGRVAVTAGVLSKCVAPGTYRADYIVPRGGGLTGNTTFTRYWTVATSGGPYDIADIECTVTTTGCVTVPTLAIAAGPSGATGATGPTGATGATGTFADTNGTITAPSSTNLALNGGSSGAGIVVETANPGRILLNPLQPVNASYLDMIFAQGTVTGTFLGDTFLSRSSLVANNATINNHSAALLGEFRATGTTSASQYVAGLYGVVYQRASGLLSEAIGAHSVVKIQGNANITEAAGFKTEMAQDTGTGRMVTVRNFYGTGLTNTSGAAIPTTLVGFDAADMGAAGVQATNVYAFRSAGNTPSLFAGPVSAGSLSTQGALTSTYTLASSSSTTGAITTAGGLGVAKDIYGGQGLFLSGTSNTATNGVNFGTANEAMFRAGAGSLKITGGGALTIDMDVKPNTTGTYDLGTASLKWRQLFVSGAASVGSLSVGGTAVTSTNGTSGQFLTSDGAGGYSTAVSGTGTGSVVRATSPSLTTPDLGTPSAVVLTNATGLPLGSTGVTGTLPVTRGGTGTTTSTGSGNVVLSSSPTIATPTLTGDLKVGAATAGPIIGGGIVNAVDGSNSSVQNDAYGTGFYGTFYARAASGTKASPSAIPSGRNMAVFGARGYGATGFGVNATGALVVKSTEAWTDSAQGTKVIIQTTPNGSTTPGDVLTADQDGTVTGNLRTTLTGTTSSIGGGALAAGACASGTATVTGATTSMSAMAAPTAGNDPTNSGALGVSVVARVSASNTVTVSVCAPIAGTPAAATYAVRVF